MRNDGNTILCLSFMALLALSAWGQNPLDLQLRADARRLGVGETTQLRVLRPQPDGSTIDVTADPETTYSTTQDHMLIAESDGRVTCVGTRGKSSERGLISARHGDRRGSLPFTLAAQGPGPGLEVTVERPVLAEGEKTRLRVYGIDATGGKDELSSVHTGTKYLIFSGLGRPDDEVLTVDDSGVATAAASIEPLSKINALVFVRNGARSGWASIDIVRTHS